MKKVLVFIVAYNAEKHIASVLSRIPENFLKNPNYKCDILLIDDASSDNTTEVARNSNIIDKNQITIIRNEKNLGYGGNQKKGYNYAINNGYDAVILLHGDGQYAPELLENMIKPILENDADCVLGSRWCIKKML